MRDAGTATSRDVLCWQQSYGCVLCVGREGESPFLEAEQSRPTVCHPREPDNCVEFCTALAPDCALPWRNDLPGCVFDKELDFRQALFNRDAADRPQVTFTGRVTDEAGHRVEGAQVRLWLSWRNGLTKLGDQVTGRDGGFRLTLRTGPWSYALRISHPGLASEIVERLSAEKLDKPGPQPRIFHLIAEHTIKGRVVDAANGGPVAGATVAAVRTPEEALQASEAITADDGSFTLAGLEARRYFLRVSSFGWRPAAPKGGITAPAARITVKLERTNVIRGVVRDANGEPVDKALVAAVFSGVPGAPTLPYTWTTDSEGRFAEDRFTAGTGYLWARRGDMFVYPPEKVELAPAQEVSVVLSLRHKGARISGKVRAADGYTLGPESRALLLSRSPLAFPRPAVGEINAAGDFAIVGVLPGRYELSIRDGGRSLGIVRGPHDVEVPIEPDSQVSLPEPVVVRPQLSVE
jgi:hypothetical protein